MKRIDITGKRFGRLVVKKYYETRDGIAYWECICDCDNSKSKIINGSNLRKGYTKSCGCIRKEGIKQSNKYDLSNNEYGIGYCKNGETFYFDKEDYEKINTYCWGFYNRYVSTRPKNKNRIYIHRIIMGIENPNIIIDHIDRNPRNNRKNNLRVCSQAQNSKNRWIGKNNKTGVLGVCFFRGKFLANIQCDGKKFYLGSYDCLSDAENARKIAERKYWGDFCPSNTLDKNQ